MTIKRHILCDLCHESFWHEIERRSDPNPDECPLCRNTGTVILQMPKRKFIPQAPAIRGLVSKSADQVYKAMEDSSVARMQTASEMFGIDKSELSEMKITNLKDNAKVGENSAIFEPRPLVQNPNLGTVGFGPTPSVQQIPSSTGLGIPIRTSLNSRHHEIAAQVTRNGEVGRHK